MDEEDFLPRQRKAERLERKLAQKLDRSRYKKTDIDKIKIKTIERPLSVGRVLSIASQDIEVFYENHIHKAVLRGALKQYKNRSKNLIAVGDEVLIEDRFITHILPRRTLLSRIDHLHKHKEQLIAANVDQVIITLSVVSPHLKPFLFDRYIIAAVKGGIHPLLVINKIELLPEDPKEQLLFNQFFKDYVSLGYEVIALSCKTNAGMDLLQAAMRNKTSVFSGQSGTGKSSLINKITGLQYAVGDIVRKTNKGMHTTTSTRMVALDGGGFCIDTPGIRSFGVWKLTREEVEGYFHEIHEEGALCRFASCTHTHEPSCAVIKAVEEMRISSLRYDSYLKLLDEAKEGKTAHIF
ncbi:MAG: ribosome small subunit-dependent GTPase A [Chlamydiae bacterium]|nr:ribosome small subunit-dependent GTPase A [Chlamydiota bacterium]